MTPLHIDILNFLKTGNFDVIRIGQSKGWIADNFPKPDSVWDTDEGSIWSYGNIELHFNENELFMIYSDHFNTEKLHAGEHISLNNWIFDRPRSLTLKNVIQALNTEHIDFQKTTNELNITLTFSSGVVLYFENHKDIENLDPNKYHLMAFAFKNN